MHSILIEGSDCVGKSTLVEALRSKTGFMGIHCGPPNPNWMADHFLTLLQPMTISDRGFPSSYVYDRVRMKSDDEILVKNLDHLEYLFQEVPGTLTVVVTCTEEVLLERLAKRGDKEFSENDIVTANRLFKHIAKLFNVHIELSDANAWPSHPDILHHILERLEE